MLFSQHRVRKGNNSFFARFTRWSNDKISVAIFGEPFDRDDPLAGNSRDDGKTINYHIHVNKKTVTARRGIADISESKARRKKAARRQRISYVDPHAGITTPQYIPPLPPMEPPEPVIVVPSPPAIKEPQIIVVQPLENNKGKEGKEEELPVIAGV